MTIMTNILIGNFLHNYGPFHFLQITRDKSYIFLIFESFNNENNNNNNNNNNDEKGTCMLIDVATSGDRNVIKKEDSKI